MRLCLLYSHDGGQVGWKRLDDCGGAGLEVGGLGPREGLEAGEELASSVLGEGRHDAAQRNRNSRGGDHARPHVGERVVRGGQGDDRLSLSSELRMVDGGVDDQLGDDVVQVVQRSAGAEVPLELVQDHQLPLPDLLKGDGEVCVHDKLFTGDRCSLLEL